MTFLPDCYRLATGSDDNTIKIWDLRKKGTVNVIAAHSKLISDIKFAGENLDKMVLASSSYD